MNIEELRDYCLSLPYTSESMPFDECTVVFKVGTENNNKIFALSTLDRQPPQVNLKCDPERAIALREEFPCIIPGYHMNKKHWNTVILRQGVGREMLEELIHDSYVLVFKSLPKKVRDEIQ